MNAVYFVVRCIAFTFIFVGKGVIFVAIRVGKFFKFWCYDVLDRLSTRHLRSKYWEQRILTCSAITLVSLFNTLSIPFFLTWLLHNWWWMFTGIGTIAILGTFSIYAIWSDGDLDFFKWNYGFDGLVKREDVKWHAEIETTQLKKEKKEKEKEAIIAKMYTDPDPSKMKRKIKL